MIAVIIFAIVSLIEFALGAVFGYLYAYRNGEGVVLEEAEQSEYDWEDF